MQKTSDERAAAKSLQIETGATGLEPATSGVTGRVKYDNAQRARRVDAVGNCSLCINVPAAAAAAY
jgi:hypothetical protein